MSWISWRCSTCFNILQDVLHFVYFSNKRQLLVLAVAVLTVKLHLIAAAAPVGSIHESPCSLRLIKPLPSCCSGVPMKTAGACRNSTHGREAFRGSRRSLLHN
jgi:hypothetical protein